MCPFIIRVEAQQRTSENMKNKKQLREKVIIVSPIPQLLSSWCLLILEKNKKFTVQTRTKDCEAEKHSFIHSCAENTDTHTFGKYMSSSDKTQRKGSFSVGTQK